MAQRRTPEAPDELVEVGGGVRLATWTRRDPARDTLPVVLVHGGPGLWDYLGDLAALVEAGTVHRFPDGIWMFGGPASMTALLDGVQTALG